MSDVDDNDAKIALLASLLEPATYPISEYLEALTGAHGDVALAAEALLLPRIQSAGKRKAGSTLESWLGKKRGVATESVEDNQASDIEKNVAVSTSPSKGKPSSDLLAMFRQSSPSKTKAKTIPQPALLLTSQAAIDRHKLPVTLAQSPLSPALASALYLAMMDESETWDRNRFYLAGKWVESPHTTTVYAREGGGYGERLGAEGQARYFYSGTELGTPNVSRHCLAPATPLSLAGLSPAAQACGGPDRTCGQRRDQRTGEVSLGMGGKVEGEHMRSESV